MTLELLAMGIIGIAPIFQSGVYSCNYFAFTKLKHVAKCACGHSGEEAHAWIKG